MGFGIAGAKIRECQSRIKENNEFIS